VVGYHKGSGVIVYDPFRGPMKRRTENWCVIDLDREITRYYRWWIKYEKHILLQRPSWDAHISIVRGEKIKPEVQHLWKKYHQQRVEFFYRHVGDYQIVRSGLTDSPDDGNYFIVEVQCDIIDKIRNELQLKTGWFHHLTFGRTYEYQARQPKRVFK
jgi:hypothetical protein